MGDRAKWEPKHRQMLRFADDSVHFLDLLPGALFPGEQGGLLINGTHYELPGQDLLPRFQRWRGDIRQSAPESVAPSNVIGLFPFGVRPKNPSRVDSSIESLLASLPFISQSGFGIFLLPSFFTCFRRFPLEETLKEQGFFVHAVVKTPPRFLPDTAISSVFVAIARTKVSEVLFWDPESWLGITIDALEGSSRDSATDLTVGVRMPLEQFGGFEAWYLKRQLDAIGGDYTTYDEYRLVDVATSMKSCRTGQEFESIPDAVYIPLIGSSPVVVDIEMCTLKHQNYAQVGLDASRASPEFLANFMNSRFGRAVLSYEREFTGAVIPRTNLSRLQELRIKLPPLETQLAICLNLDKIKRLREIVGEIEENLSINPISGTESARLVDNALEAFGRLSEEDRLVEKIRRGESKTTEFKQTLAMEIKDGTKQKYIELNVIKTVAAFLNSDGGDLFIGVADDGSIVGVDAEVDQLFKGSTDKFLLHFKNLIKAQIGEQFYPLINQQLVRLPKASVLHVRCEKSSVEVFVDGTEFYVRTNPATDKLEGRKLVEYIRQRFGGAVLG